MKNPNLNLPANANSPANSANPLPTKRQTWEQAEGNPLPLGVRWIEEEQAFNFAVHSEHADSVTLFLYSPADLVNPLLTVRFNFLHNKSGRIWHCRIPLAKIGDAHYYAYSVSGENIPQLHSFDPQKILLDPYAKSIFFPPGFDRTLAMREGSNAGHAPLGVLSDHRSTFDWAGVRPPHHESDAIIYELHVKGFTKNPNSGVDPSRAGTYAGLVEKIPYLKELGSDHCRTDAGFSARSAGGRLLGLYAFKLLRAPCPVCEHGAAMSSILNSRTW